MNIYEILEKTLPAIECLIKHELEDLSKTDTSINDIYHVLEYITLDAVELAKLTKHLRALLVKRRTLKNSIALNQSSIDSVKAFIKRRHDSKAEVAKRTIRHERESMESYERLKKENIL